MEKKPRCGRGTRRSKVTGNCEPTAKSTRCPRGSRRNKTTGECDQILSPATETRHTARKESVQEARKESVQDKERFDALISRQEKECPRIVNELQVHGRKTSHWAWWVFPTEKPGMSEPKPVTAVTRTNAPDLFKRAPHAWQEALELIVELGEKKGLHDILPDIDHPRVNYFVDLFSEVDTPPWMKSVLNRLRMLLTDARQIPTLVKQQHMYDPAIQLYFYSGSSNAPPGKGTREKMPDAKLEEYRESLAPFPHFRKMFSNFGVAPFQLDGLHWQTVEHYYQGSKFKREHPDFYKTFALESGSELSKDPNMSKAYGGKTGKYKGKQVRPKTIQVDSDFFEGRIDQEMFDAQFAKFTQNAEMRKALLATKEAQLLHTMPRSSVSIPFDNLVYIREWMKKGKI
jgi:predicted NAD-dependent protein-ADP-ribosyltransferase YbiA (DUF1768 family)